MPDLVDQIVLVWNNLKVEPPPLPDYPVVPVTIIRSNRNSLNNRFSVGDVVRTSLVLTQDDDQLLFRPLLRCMVSGWTSDMSIMGTYARLWRR